MHERDRGTPAAIVAIVAIAAGFTLMIVIGIASMRGARERDLPKPTRGFVLDKPMIPEPARPVDPNPVVAASTMSAAQLLAQATAAAPVLEPGPEPVPPPTLPAPKKRRAVKPGPKKRECKGLERCLWEAFSVEPQ